MGTFATALKGLSRHPSFWAIILFTLLYKAGDAMMGIMVIPFWKSLSFTGTEIGLVSGMLGSAATTLGGLLGGWYTSPVGIATSLWVLGLTQAMFHLGYWLAALPGMGRLVLFHLPLPFLDLGARVYPIYLASAGESFAVGLGYAPFMAFMMSLCDKRYSATQYAFFVFLFVQPAALWDFWAASGSSTWALPISSSSPSWWPCPPLRCSPGSSPWPAASRGGDEGRKEKRLGEGARGRGPMPPSPKDYFL